MSSSDTFFQKDRDVARLEALGGLPYADAPGLSRSRQATINEEISMTPPKILDVRTLIPMERHRVIFETYGKLELGESFVLVNDHDPKPLYYQFEAEHTGNFSWNYREQGPGTWQVEIGRTAATRR